jgi:hypothetical protein
VAAIISAMAAPLAAAAPLIISALLATSTRGTTTPLAATPAPIALARSTVTLAIPLVWAATVLAANASPMAIATAAPLAAPRLAATVLAANASPAAIATAAPLTATLLAATALAAALRGIVRGALIASSARHQAVRHLELATERDPNSRYALADAVEQTRGEKRHESEQQGIFDEALSLIFSQKLSNHSCHLSQSRMN